MKKSNILEKYEKRVSKSVEVAIGFTQGYVCAVCTLIRMEGCITTQSFELWQCGGLKNIEDIELYGIDEYDAEIIYQYQSELFKK